MYVRYRRKGEKGTTAFKSMMKYIFKYEDDGSAPYLSGKFELFADRGYWGQEMLRYLISMGADILGTVKRLNWFLYTYGKKKSMTSSKSSEKPESISIDGAPWIFQKTAKHNLGKSSAKDQHELTTMAFRNGYSSAIGMKISSDPQYTNFVDLTIISSAKHAKMYFKEEKTKKEAIMSVFSFIAGSDRYDSEEDEGDDFLIHTGWF